MIRWGALPLGFKKEYGLFRRGGQTLNVGLLDPGRRDALADIEKAVRAQIPGQRSKVFLVLADQFLDVLDKVYGVSRAALLRRPEEQLDPTLRLFLTEEDGREGH